MEIKGYCSGRNGNRSYCTDIVQRVAANSNEQKKDRRRP